LQTKEKENKNKIEKFKKNQWQCLESYKQKNKKINKKILK
jgi:hypothetical protein